MEVARATDVINLKQIDPRVFNKCNRKLKMNLVTHTSVEASCPACSRQVDMIGLKFVRHCCVSAEETGPNKKQLSC